MQKSQRKQQRLALHKRQDFISTNHCSDCVNRNEFYRDEFCGSCPIYDELQGIGNRLIAISGRGDDDDG